MCCAARGNLVGHSVRFLQGCDNFLFFLFRVKSGFMSWREKVEPEISHMQADEQTIYIWFASGHQV